MIELLIWFVIFFLLWLTMGIILRMIIINGLDKRIKNVVLHLEEWSITEEEANNKYIYYTHRIHKCVILTDSDKKIIFDTMLNKK